MRAGAFSDLRVIRLINRRFKPYYFNTGGPGLGRNNAAKSFVDSFSKPHGEIPGLSLLTAPDGVKANTAAYFCAFNVNGDGALLGLNGGWKNLDEAEDLRMLYPSKFDTFDFLVRMLKENPEFNKFTELEKAAIQAAKDNPKDPVCLNAAGVIEEELGNYATATTLFDSTIEHGNGKAVNEIADAWRAKLRIARYSKDWNTLRKTIESASIANQEQALEIGPDIEMEWAYSEISQEQYDAAYIRLKTAIMKFPGSTRLGEFHYYAGVACFFLKNKPSAYYHWCWIVENIPDDHLARRAVVTAAHEDFPYPNHELGGFKSEGMIHSGSISAAYQKALKHYNARAESLSQKVGDSENGARK